MTDLRWRIEHYLQDSGITPTRFGRDCARDPRLVHDMRRGRTVGARLAARILAYLAQRGVGQ